MGRGSERDVFTFHMETLLRAWLGLILAKAWRVEEIDDEGLYGLGCPSSTTNQTTTPHDPYAINISMTWISSNNALRRYMASPNAPTNASPNAATRLSQPEPPSSSRG